MKKYIGIMHKYKTTSMKRTSKTAYAYNESKKCKWLQRICIRILKKLSCYHQYHQEVVKRTEINIEGLMDFIIAQRREILEQAHHNRGSLIVYLGESELCRFEEDMRTTTQMVNTSARYGMNGQMQFMDMEVILVPHWQGVLVVPSKR